MSGQMDLFGGPDIPVPTQRQTRRGPRSPVTDDPDLIASVIRAASDPGYVVIGPARRVYRRCGASGRISEVDRVADYENGAVHQLLDQGLLTVGGNRNVTYRGQEGLAHSVLVPKKTRAMGWRWSGYVRPSTFGPARYVDTSDAP